MNYTERVFHGFKEYARKIGFNPQLGTIVPTAPKINPCPNENKWDDEVNDKWGEYLGTLPTWEVLGFLIENHSLVDDFWGMLNEEDMKKPWSSFPDPTRETGREIFALAWWSENSVLPLNVERDNLPYNLEVRINRSLQGYLATQESQAGMSWLGTLEEEVEWPTIMQRIEKLWGDMNLPCLKVPLPGNKQILKSEEKVTFLNRIEVIPSEGLPSGVLGYSKKPWAV